MNVYEWRDGRVVETTWGGEVRRVPAADDNHSAKVFGLLGPTVVFRYDVQQVHRFSGDVWLYLPAGVEPTEHHALVLSEAEWARLRTPLPVQEAPDWRPAEVIGEDYYSR